MQTQDNLSEPLISIVMGYFNRLDQTEITFNTILKTSYTNYEVIIVDDASEPQHDLKKIIYKYKFPIRLIRIEKTQKTWINPCVAYNIALKVARGDIIIIQNPEVAHIGDVIKFVVDNIKEGVYLGFSVYSSPSFVHNNIFKNILHMDKEYIYQNFIANINYEDFKFNYEYYINKYTDLKKFDPIEAFQHWQKIGSKEGKICNSSSVYQPDAYIKWKGWYNHPVHNNRPYHFLTAITRNDLKKVGGFDDNFKNGLWYDDEDLLMRISKVCKVINFDTSIALGIHLYHDDGSAEQMNQKNFTKLTYINKRIKRGNCKFNIICAPTGDLNDFHYYKHYDNK